MTATSIPTDDELYALAQMHIPLDVYDRLKKQSYREADGRHVSHKAILPSLLLAALKERGVLSAHEDAAV